ncbi:MAG: GGDEF domain-containing protein, partial [Candidatus Limnocylindria bacterium]
MDTTRPMALFTALASRLFLLALPLLALGLLRLYPALVLSGPSSWIGPTAALITAACATLAMMVAAADGLRTGSLRFLLVAAGMGVLAAAFAAEATGPGTVATPTLPTGGLAIGGFAAAGILLAAGIASLRGMRIETRRGRLLALAGVFLAAELGLGAALLLRAGSLPPTPAAAVEAAAVVLFAATMALAILGGDDPMPAGLLGVGLGIVTLARANSLDLAVAFGTLAAGCLVMAAGMPRRAPVVDGDAPPALPTDHGAVQMGSQRAADTADTVDAVIDEESDAARLSRELRGTLEDLIRARRTIELQREELAVAASIDQLTGVLSRRAVLDRLRIEVAECRRYSHPLAIVLVDLDGFAALNARHGIAIGDAVLHDVGLRLRLRMRAADALGRLGGDSFLVILPHTDERGAAILADVLQRRAITHSTETDGGPIELAVSIGVALMRPGTEISDDELLAAADEALASARAGGGNRIAFDRNHGLARLEERRDGS